jgi:hypothetical protein
MTAQYKGGSDATLYASAADWVSPIERLPPEATGNKVIINDTDHSFYYTELQAAGHSGQRRWAWQNFARGNNLLFMDPYLQVWPGRNDPRGGVDPYWDEIRNTLGDIRAYAAKIDLAQMTPQHALVGDDGFCLANPGAEYLVFMSTPKHETTFERLIRRFTAMSFALTTVPGTYDYEWFDPSRHSVVDTGNVTVKSSHVFKAPFPGDSVLWLHR